jgi:hypothetical protein
MPVILAIQEARRIAVQSQLGQIVHETLAQENPSQKRKPITKKKTHHKKENPSQKRAGGEAQEHPPSKCEALSSNPNATHTQKK